MHVGLYFNMFAVDMNDSKDIDSILLGCYCLHQRKTTDGCKLTVVLQSACSFFITYLTMSAPLFSILFILVEKNR